MNHDWKVGDRASRQVFLDDGTWARNGDKCLSYSPRRFGTIVAVLARSVRVQFDDSDHTDLFLPHGLDKEPPHA